MTDDIRPSELARRLGVSTRTVQRWIEAGRLPARRVGGRWFVAFDAFDASQPPATPIQAVFVANRGEIANRIERTCQALGMRCILPATDGGPRDLDLLDAEAVVAAAVDAGADAVHPGFGFLAENADFAERVIAAGLRWIGPPPDAIRAMGDKAAARRLAMDLDIPVPAGDDGDDQSDEAFVVAAARIGYPLLIKPAAGGGGKGMRTIRDPADLTAGLASARREARSAFGDDRLILEYLVTGARHVEIQVLFDAHGHGVHLGERDCSTQRRHQKVLEEAPSPVVSPALRRRLGDAALRLAAAVGYVGAGTCEFLVDARGRATFLEMNTRLQVEHPVTELVTGRDLVADQIRIAAGEPLALEQADVRADGHAIEVRLYAEDAEDGFLPATGRIERLRWPAGEGVRVDAGVAEGDEVSARFDPMLAKVIAHGPTRDIALDRLTAALDATVVLGLTTNLRFLRWLVREPAIRNGLVRTDTLERIWPPDDWAARVVVPDGLATAATARLLEVESPRVGEAAWIGGWRLNGAPTVLVEVDGRRVAVAPRPDVDVEVVVAGDVAHVDVGGRSVPVRLASPPDVDRAARAAASAHAGGPVDVVAPMPGRVIAVHAADGATVDAGAPVITIEAMKMEHVVPAPITGRVVALVAVGDQVDRASRLATIEP